MSFFAELKRRNVIRVGLAYVLMGWVLLQGADFAFDLIGAPNWVIQSLTVIVAIGLPIALFFAWAFELTPEGIKRDEDVDRSQPAGPRSGRTLDRLIIAFLAVVIALLVGDRLLGTSGSGKPANTASGDSYVTIAVLPFVNMSSDQEQEYFSDGITEEILNRLAKVDGLQVTARTSTFSFKGQNLDVREIAETLGVENILEGSVRRDGEQVRITAQLVRAEDGFHLWSETFDRRLESIFTVQDEISGEIADALRVNLGITDAVSESREVDPEAFDLYLQARALHRARGRGLVRAVELFEQSLEIDPDFAPAWAGLSHSLNVVNAYASREQSEALGDVEAKSIEAATHALELDPNLPTALHAMAQAMLSQYRMSEAGEYFERAIKADPDSTALMEDYNHFLAYTWQLEAAEKVAQRMVELDPLVPIFLFSAATTYNALGDVETRDRHIDAALKISPNLSNVQAYKMQALMETGQIEAALAYAKIMDFQGWTTAEDMQRLIQWTTTPDEPLDEGMQAALGYLPSMAIYAGREDLWVEYGWNNNSITNWENMLGELSMLSSPVGNGVYRKMLALPETHEAIEEVGLPDYWREVGWPPGCEPVGEDDFNCE